MFMHETCFHLIKQKSNDFIDSFVNLLIAYFAYMKFQHYMKKIEFLVKYKPKENPYF